MKRMKFLAAALFVLGADAASRTRSKTAHDARHQGEYLARAGDCVACHSVPGGKAFAGGLKMGTPMGAIYSTNITPDPETGIGNYSFEDFDRAVRGASPRTGTTSIPRCPIRPMPRSPTRTCTPSTTSS